jgi:hypothetical protein
MDATEPGLFDLPEQEPSTTAKRGPARGRNRETWTRTATAVVTILDAAAVLQAAARMEETGITIQLGADPGAEDEDTGPAIPGPGAAPDPLDALAWQIWPTAGLEGLLEVGAFQVLAINSDVATQSEDRARVTWTVTVKLTDVDQLRRLAIRAHPEDEALIPDSLEVAWQHAADPFAPLRSIPGITWQPGHVQVEHQPARAARNR